jgi:hypothetical protein
MLRPAWYRPIAGPTAVLAVRARELMRQSSTLLGYPE